MSRARCRVLLPFALLALGASCVDRHLTPIRGLESTTDDSGAPPGDCSAALIGFATGTVGGQGGQEVTVSTPEDLQTNASSTDHLIIHVKGMIPVTGQVEVSSFKTIIGLGPASGLSGGGLNLADGSDIVIRNLVITKALGTDAVSLRTSKNIWIDHCDLSSDMDNGKDYYDGLVDIAHGSDNVTVSWTRFHDHFHVSLIGRSDDDVDEDTGHLNVTFHHNLFDTTYSYNPSIRFGTLHAFNNHYRAVSFSGITSRMGAKVLAESNYFDTVVMPLTTVSDSAMDGFMNAKDTNIFVNSSANDITQTTNWTPSYLYTADPVLSVPAIVARCAGTGKLPQ
jgi:pectate lyase